MRIAYSHSISYVHCMIGKRAKILSAKNVQDLLIFARQTRHPIRNAALVLLSVKAGLRAGEIANLTWSMLVEPTGEIKKYSFLSELQFL